MYYRMGFRRVPDAAVEQAVRYQPEGDASERHGDDGEKGRYRLFRFVPFHVRGKRQHKRADDNKRRRYDRVQVHAFRDFVTAADHLRERVEKKRQQKHRACHQGCKPRPASGGHSGNALNVTGNGSRSQHRTADACKAVGQQRFPRVRQAVVFHQPGAGADGGQGADGIEEIEYKKNEYHGYDLLHGNCAKYVQL